MNLNFRAEFFNRFNRPNFGRPQNQVFPEERRRAGNVGRIGEIAGSNQQIQFGLKFVF